MLYHLKIKTETFSGHSQLLSLNMDTHWSHLFSAKISKKVWNNVALFVLRGFVAIFSLFPCNNKNLCNDYNNKTIFVTACGTIYTVQILWN